MDKGKVATGIILLTLLFLAIGYVLATAFLTFRDLGMNAELDFLWLAKNYRGLQVFRPDDFRLVNLIVGGFGLTGLLLSAVLSGNALTKFGRTQWQRTAHLRKNGFFGKPGSGFVIGKTGSPKSRTKLLCSTVFPHALIVAPTGRGKTSGFVIPNLLAFKGSAVILDVKGDCFQATARHRSAQGDKVYRFAPVDWHDRRSHRYNPLLRIAELKDPDRKQMELQLLATLFLQTDSDRTQGLLKGGIDLFVAAGLLAFERNKPTLGEIYRITASGGSKQKEFMKRRDEIQNQAGKLIFERMASTNNDTLTSYVSLLMTSGLDQWSNPAIDKATQVSDFDFRTIRKKPFSVFLVVSPNMVKPMAALIRLFFSDLISSLQDKEPGPDEPWPVMILLDEFNRLGKMPIVTDSIETLRAYKGHLAIVTQTIPALDEIYGENTRRALQGNAGVKLYLTPSDEKTVEELSKAVGKTTKRVVTRSRSIGRNPFEGRSMSERTEEVSLLPEDEARRLSLEDIIIVVDAQMPIRAKRIKWYDDPFFKKIHSTQVGELPFPETHLDGVVTVERPKQEVTRSSGIAESNRTGQKVSSKDQLMEDPDPIPEGGAGADVPEGAERAKTDDTSIEMAAAMPHGGKIGTSGRKKAQAVVHATRDFEDRQGQLDLAEQQKLNFQTPNKVTAADLAAIEDADNALAALEEEFSTDNSGGVSVSAAE